MPNIRNEYLHRLDIARIKKRRFSIYLVVDLVEMKIVRKYSSRENAVQYIKFIENQAQLDLIDSIENLHK